jgi:hypothetical protein
MKFVLNISTFLFSLGSAVFCLIASFVRVTAKDAGERRMELIDTDPSTGEQVHILATARKQTRLNAIAALAVLSQMLAALIP